MTDCALIVGAGNGLSAAIARLFSAEGVQVALASRDTTKLSALCDETSAKAFACDASDPNQVSAMFESIETKIGAPKIVVYNAGAYTRGPIVDVDAAATKDVLLTNAYGAFLVAQQAARLMLREGGGSMLFTGASAGVKGYAESAPFAMGKFALRGLCQSLARELSPKNIHVAHFVIDGMIYSKERGTPFDDPNTTLNPDEIAKTYLSVARQNRSAWTSELALRTSVEAF